MQKPAAAGDSALGTARRPPAPHTCIGAQQQSHVARRRGRAQPDGRGAPQAAPAARPPLGVAREAPRSGAGGLFYQYCARLVRAQLVYKAGSLDLWSLPPWEFGVPGVGLKTVFFACFPGIFPPWGGETRTLCLSPPPLECFAAARRGFPGKANTFQTAILRPKPQNLFSGASLIGNTQGIGEMPGGHFLRRPRPSRAQSATVPVAFPPGPERAGPERPGPARPPRAGRPGAARRSAVRNFFHDFLAIFSRKIFFHDKILLL